MSTTCRYEFQCKLFGFYDCKSHDFYVSQWTTNKLLFLVYRCLFFFYSLAWIIADVIENPQPQYWIFLTNWSEVTVCLYFGLSCLLAVYGYFSNKADLDKEKGANWACGVVWILFDVSFSVSLVTNVLYWSLLRVGSVDLITSFNIHSHAITFVMLLIDVFIIAYPIRLLHFLYGMCYGLVYTAFTLILHGSGYISAVYELINWDKGARIATAICFVSSFVAIPLVHLLAFGLYHLRCFIALKGGCQNDQTDTSDEQESIEMGQTNQGYAV
ncbi:protein rolling stone-like [Ciona intestinalis]